VPLMYLNTDRISIPAAEENIPVSVINAFNEKKSESLSL